MTMTIEDNSLVFKKTTHSNKTLLNYKLDTFQCIVKLKNHATLYLEEKEEVKTSVKQIFIRASNKCNTGAMKSKS